MVLMFFTIKPRAKISLSYTYSPIIVFFIFIFGYCISFFSNTDREISNQFLLSVLVLFLIYPIQTYRTNIDKIVKFSGILMCIYTGLLFLIVFMLPGSPLMEPAIYLLREASGGSFGMRSFTGEDASIGLHLGTVPFLYLPFILYFNSFLNYRRIADLLAIILLLFFIVISASRGLWTICTLGALLIFFLRLKRAGRILLVSVLIPFVVFTFQYLESNTEAISADETSNSVKIGHVESFFDNLNFSNFFIGDGLGSYYYSKGSGIMKSNTEITPLDMIRYFGVFMTIILYFAIIFPSAEKKDYQNKALYIFIFILYVINSFTNPIMFNSYGLLIVLWYWSKILTDTDYNIILLKQG